MGRPSPVRPNKSRNKSTVATTRRSLTSLQRDPDGALTSRRFEQRRHTSEKLVVIFDEHGLESRIMELMKERRPGVLRLVITYGQAHSY